MKDATASGVAKPACATPAAPLDVWFAVEVPPTGKISVQGDRGDLDKLGLQLYTGSNCGALSAVAGACDEHVAPSVSATGLTPGDTVWIRAWPKSSMGANGIFNMCVFTQCDAVIAPANDDPCGAIEIPIQAHCFDVSYSNFCATNSTGVLGLANPSCGAYGGDDVWFKVTVPASGNVTLGASRSSTIKGCLAVYSSAGACPALALTEIACSNLDPTSISLTGRTPGEVIYIRWWIRNAKEQGYFNICAADVCPSLTPPANNEPCNASPLTLGSMQDGTTQCADAVNEPAAPGCWAGTSTNTVWYSFVAPASGQVNIRTQLYNLVASQIAVYSGACGAGMTLVSCASSGTVCGSATPGATLNLAGLTPGNTYYIAVDGKDSWLGTFGIVAFDPTAFSLPPLYGYDCGSPIALCGSTPTVTYASPGPSGSGNVCDFGAGGGCGVGSGLCIGTGEVNSAWYTFMVNDGTLNFSITPFARTNDINFVLYDITGITDYCTRIANSTFGPIRCNSSNKAGQTGTSLGSTSTCISGGNDPYVSPVTIGAGTGPRTFLLVVMNAAGTQSGFTIDFGTTPFYVPPTTTWTGAYDGNWTNLKNWSGCMLPDCNTDVTILNTGLNSPVIGTGTTVTARSLTIGVGSRITLTGTGQLDLCGSYTNSGSLTADPTSVIRFTGPAAAHTISGPNTGSNAFGSLVVDKTGAGTVAQSTDLELNGSFTLASSANNLYNLNGKILYVGGDFSILPATASFSHSNGDVVFDGAADQQYTNASGDAFQDVQINKAAGQLILNSDMPLASPGILTLTSGVVKTGASKIDVLSSATGAVSGGSTTTYVWGNLRRGVTGANAYNFPVGGDPAGKGYQLINVNFTAASGYTNLMGSFSPTHTGSIPSPAPGPYSVFDCGVYLYNVWAGNGEWTLAPTPASPASKGTYTVTAYPRNFTAVYSTYDYTPGFRAGGTAATTLVKRSAPADYALDGDCVPGLATSNLAAATPVVTRSGITTGFSDFAVAVSELTPFPIELMNFGATPIEGAISLMWTTASERNNRGFEVQRSTDGHSFARLGWVNGAGDSDSDVHYGFLDTEAETDVRYYYRLRQMDHDGSTSFSNVAEAMLTDDVNLGFQIYPNPSDGMVSVEITSAYRRTVTLDVVNMLGQRVTTKTLETEPGVSRTTVDLTQLPVGNYAVVLTGAGADRVVKVMLNR